MTDAERAKQELATVPQLGMSPHGLQMVTGWDVERAKDALRELLASGEAVGGLDRRVRLAQPPTDRNTARGAQTRLRYIPGKSAIAACGWDAEAGTLELIFRTNLQRIYRYHSVSLADGATMYEAANCAERMEVFKAVIKDRYTFSRVQL